MICACWRKASGDRHGRDDEDGRAPATGLVFVTGGDRKIHAFDAETGKELWAEIVGAPTRGLPSMYEHNGRQFLLVTANIIGANESEGLSSITSAPDLPKGWIAWSLPASIGQKCISNSNTVGKR